MVALVAAAIAATAVAAPAAPSPPPIAWARARLQVSAPAPAGRVLRLYTAPSARGGQCLLVELVRAGSRVRPSGPGGAECGIGTTPFQIGLALSSRRARVGGRALAAYVDGWVAPRLRAARVELVWRRGRQRLRLAHGYFLGATPILFDPPFADLPFSLVAYAAEDREVARQKLDNADLYLDWKRDHLEAKLRAYWQRHGKP